MKAIAVLDLTAWAVLIGGLIAGRGHVHGGVWGIVFLVALLSGLALAVHAL